MHLPNKLYALIVGCSETINQSFGARSGSVRAQREEQESCGGQSML